MIGTLAKLTGLVLLTAGALYYLKRSSEKSNELVDIQDLSSEDDKHETQKWIVEDAITKKDIEKLKRILDSGSISKYPDLITMINKFISDNSD